MLFFSNYAHTFFFTRTTSKDERERKKEETILSILVKLNLFYLFYISHRGINMILTAVSIRERHKHHWWSTRTTCQLIPIKFNETHEMSKAKLLLFFSISSDSWSNLIEEKVVQMKTTEREREKKKFRRWHYTLI